MQQIIHIGGGEAKENYKDFLDFICGVEFNPYKEKRVKWNQTLGKDLGEDFDYIKIPMYDKYFADYTAWKTMFEKVVPYLKDDVIFIGHSLGGTFLVKYFNELPLSSGCPPQGSLSGARLIHLVPQGGRLMDKVKKIFLLAPAFKDSENEVIGSFNFDPKLENIQKIAEKITIMHSKDDFVVPYKDFEDFKKALPEAEYISFENKNHFLDEEFPELLEILRK